MSKAPKDVGSISPSPCTYKGRGFKSMTAVRRHVRDQHKKHVKRCDYCVQYFPGAEDVGLHKARGSCTREGIQKGQGQVREWEALFSALYPGTPTPRTPFYDNHSSTPITQGRISPVEEEASSPTASSADTRDSNQHRQVALQTIDILRSNVDSFSVASTQSGEHTMIGVVQALLPLIQQTSQVSAQQIEQSAASCTVPGPVAQAQSNDTLSDIEKFLDSLPDMGNATFDPMLAEEDWLQLGPQNDLFNGNGFRSDLSWGH